jgi:uncharacterized protein YdaU (DUF1376 family)
LSAVKNDILMPVYIGEYLADTMHLNTEQHGAYLLLLFHLWRRGILHDDDIALAQITRLGKNAWSIARPVLADFFEIYDGLWHHGHVEQERTRASAKQQTNSAKAKLAARSRWGKNGSDASSIANAMLGEIRCSLHTMRKSRSDFGNQSPSPCNGGPNDC